MRPVPTDSRPHLAFTLFYTVRGGGTSRTDFSQALRAPPAEATILGPEWQAVREGSQGVCGNGGRFSAGPQRKCRFLRCSLVLEALGKEPKGKKPAFAVHPLSLARGRVWPSSGLNFRRLGRACWRGGCCYFPVLQVVHRGSERVGTLPRVAE